MSHFRRLEGPESTNLFCQEQIVANSYDMVAIFKLNYLTVMGADKTWGRPWTRRQHLCTGGSERSTIISSNCYLQRDVFHFLKRSENSPSLA